SCPRNQTFRNSRPPVFAGGLVALYCLFEHRAPGGAGKLSDLRAVDPGHLRVQERWRLLGGGELRLELFPPGRIRVQLVLHYRRGDALHHHLDQPLAASVEPFDLARRSRQARAMFHPEPVHLARELLAELVEQVLAQELLLEGLQDARFDLVAPDGQAVIARPLLASAETCEAIPAGHEESRATHAALRQSGEQVLRPSRDADVAGACDREAGRLLTVLRRVPQLVAHNPEGRDLSRDPFRL